MCHIFVWISYVQSKNMFIINYVVPCKIPCHNTLLYFFRVLANGVETVTVLEDGVMKSRTVNGVAQPLNAIRQ